ncbi:MAG: hypothetical protein ABJA76_00760 [Mucilaginibacter sp.]
MFSYENEKGTYGTYRIMPKVVPNSKEQLALVSSGYSTPTLAKYDMNSDNSKWNFKAHELNLNTLVESTRVHLFLITPFIGLE